MRYNLLSLVFVGFVAGSIITFLSQPGILSSADNGNHSGKISVVASRYSSDDTGDLRAVPVQKKTFIQPLIYYANKYSSLITGIWAILFFFNSLKMFSALRHANRLRTRHTIKAPQEWKERLYTLSSVLGIHKRILLKESGIIKVPVVIGSLKPVILVPLGMFSNLSVEQVEAILVHELAHVRRKDFAVNLVQRFAESCFFFNPCIIWMSALIRDEREACCDDIVLDYTADKKCYLEALMSFRDMSFLRNGHALALAGNNSLLNRVKRILTNENSKLNIMETITLIAMVAALTAFGFIPHGKTDIPEPYTAKKSPSGVIVEKQIRSGADKGAIMASGSFLSVRDTLPDRSITFKSISSDVHNDEGNKTVSVKALGSDGKRYSYKLVNDEIKELLIDGIPVDSSRYSDFQFLVKKIEDSRQQVLLAELGKQEKLLRNQQQLLNGDSLLLLKSLENDQLAKRSLMEEEQTKKNIERLQDQLEREDKNRQISKLKLNSQYERDMNKNLELQKIQQLDLQNKLQLISDEKINMDNDLRVDKSLALQKIQADEIQKKNQLILNKKIDMQNELRTNKNLNLQKAQIDDIQRKDQLLLVRKINQQHELQLNNKLQLANVQQLKLQKISLPQNDEVKEIIDDLFEAGLIKDKIRLSFTLNSDELIVDGKKQDGSLHEKLRDRYIKHKNDYFKYKSDGHSTSTEIVRD